MASSLGPNARTLAEKIQAAAGKELTAVACLTLMVHVAFHNLEDRYRIPVAPLIETQQEVVAFWLDHHGYVEGDLDNAVEALRKAGANFKPRVDQTRSNG